MGTYKSYVKLLSVDYFRSDHYVSSVYEYGQEEKTLVGTRPLSESIKSDLKQCYDGLDVGLRPVTHQTICSVLAPPLWRFLWT